MPTLTRPRNQPSRNREIIGQYLKDARIKLGLSQQEMMERVNPGGWFTAWSSVETGVRNLPPHFWEIVADVLGIPHREFAQIMMRYTNPWMYGMIYGFKPELRAELAAIPTRYEGVDPKRHRRKPRAA
jgi:transcriptional regulator with XRE-family HTH domain